MLPFICFLSLLFSFLTDELLGQSLSLSEKFYHLGTIALHEGDSREAEDHLERAIKEGGDFVIPAATQLVRLKIAKELQKKKTSLNIKEMQKIIASIQQMDQGSKELSAAVLSAAVDSLYLALHSKEALSFVEELSVQYPSSQYTGYSLLTAAKILYFEYKADGSAVEYLHKIIGLSGKNANQKAKLKAASYALLAEIYLFSEKIHEPVRGCLFLERLKKISPPYVLPERQRYLSSFCR